MTRFRKALAPLLVGCASSMAHAQLSLPDEAAARRFADIIDAASRRHGVEEALVHAVIFSESSYDPRAVSPRGALGLMQLMPETARQYGVENALDPAQNVEGGVRFLRELLDRFDDDMQLALAAYNAGPGAVVRAGRRVPPYGETLAYVPRVLDYYFAYQATVQPQVPIDASLEAALRDGELLRAILAAPALPPATEPEAPEHGKRPACIASARRRRGAHPGRIFGAGSSTPSRPEPFRSRRGHKAIEDTNEVPMAIEKRNTPRKSAESVPQVTPLPFPGESPTITLALAAGRMYGLHDEKEKPVRSRPKRKAASRKKAAAQGKAPASKRKSAAPKRKAAAARKRPVAKARTPATRAARRSSRSRTG